MLPIPIAIIITTHVLMNPHQLRFLALGDSYTIGEAVERSERWPEQLARRLREDSIDIADPEIIAKTGWTTDELNAAIDAANPQGPYDIVSLLIGVNNQYRGRDAEEYRREFAALLQGAVDFAGGDTACVFVLSIPDWGVTPFAEGHDREKIAAEIDRYNSINREETLRRGVVYIDITPQTRAAKHTPHLLANDGLHPSSLSYREWTELLIPAVKHSLLRHRR